MLGVVLEQLKDWNLQKQKKQSREFYVYCRLAESIGDNSRTNFFFVSSMLHSTFTNNNRTYILRSIAVQDAEPLATYFTELSADSKRRFQPHPLTTEQAAQIAHTPHETTIHTVLLDEKRIIGYFILETTMSEHEQGRFAQQGIELLSGVDVLFAPSVLDEFQNQGLASQVMPIFIDFLKTKNARSLVLMGGTQETNARAIAFYEKFGFVKCGGYYTEMFNHDMRLVF